uniref:Uncharacterized protein n=1 Tax=Rhizophora mucronata TaxID=61149 RepID=A0A2P2IM52_RHIMU
MGLSVKAMFSFGTQNIRLNSGKYGGKDNSKIKKMEGKRR